MQPLRGKERRAARRGLTLAELLVVVMILVLLLGIALPLVKPALEDRKIREASRQFNTFLRAAQARAVETNRNAGVWIARTDDTNLNISYQIYFAETPPPYVGESQDAAVSRTISVVMPNTSNPDAPPWLRRAALSGAFALGVQEDPANPAIDTLIKRGDRIRFNYTGPDYVIYDIYSKQPLTPTLYSGPGPARDEIIFGPAPSDIHAWGAPPNPSTGAPILVGSKFQIARQPQRSSAGSLSLPNGTAIVLSLSGMEGIVVRDPVTGNLTADRNEFQTAATPPSPAAPVVLMFRPDGSVDKVYYDGEPVGVLPNSPIHFLIGRSIVDERDPINDPQNTPNPLPGLPAIDQLAWQNLNDLNNVWVSVGHVTGAITTTAMHEWAPLVSSNPTLVEMTQAARSLARRVESVGGK